MFNLSCSTYILETGQVSVGCVHETGCIELLAIATSSTMSKRLSLSALLGKAVSAALQVSYIGRPAAEYGLTNSCMQC